MERNRQINLAARPAGEPKDSDFVLAESAIPEPGAGEMLLRTIYLSLDPYMRLRMNPVSHMPTFPIGKPLGGATISVVEKSNLPDYPVGAVVASVNGWTTYAISNGKNPFGAPLHKLDPRLPSLTAPLSLLGMPGVTAYHGLLSIGQPKPGETIVVSGAAGTVGALVGQIAKLKGCMVVGIAGGPRKCAFVKEELGFDAVVDYKGGDLAGALRAACPKGVDIYFENVGGEVFDAVLPLLNLFARIPVCGHVAEYNTIEHKVGPDKIPGLMLAVLGKRLTIRGFVVSDFAAQIPAFMQEMGGWVREGRIRYRDEITDGLENAPRAFQRMLRAENFGKSIIRVSPEPKR
jgi:NADPH-dependent curcumin reductase